MRYWIFITLGFLVGLVIGIGVYLKLRGKREDPQTPPKRRYLTLDEKDQQAAPQTQVPAAMPLSDKKPAADSLETIRGIGPVYARRLKEAGVRTFSDLAGLSDQQLDFIIGSRGGPTDFGSWREQAKELAS